MEGNILNVDKIKLYYPFLRDNRGVVSPLFDEINYLVGYLLIVDVVVVPPRELIGGWFGGSNLEAIRGSKLLRHLIQTGKIVTTSSSSFIRDAKDLVEYYSAEEKSEPPEFWIYQRDLHIQKESYISHLADHLDMVKYYSDSIKNELSEFLSSRPDHPSFMNKIDSIKRKMHQSEYERLQLEAFHGYFAGGSVGNGAIMPCMYSSDGKYAIYNPFYSKASVLKFICKLQDSLKRELHAIPVQSLDNLLNNLQIFRIRYAELSRAYEQYYTKIAEIIGKRSILIKLPTDILYITVALLIAALLADVFTKEVFWGSVFAVYAAKGTWSYINRALKITDYFAKKIQLHLEFSGLYHEYRKDIVSLTEEFESRVEKAISH